MKSHLRKYLLGFRRRASLVFGPNLHNKFLHFAEPGHFYSPVPGMDALSGSALRDSRRGEIEVPGVDLRFPEQVARMNDFIDRFGALPADDATRRYRWNNPYFSYADAWATSCMLKHFRPQKIIEVGSGHSSALMLDTVDADPTLTTQLTFIEPYPDRLFGLIGDKDKKRCDILVTGVQHVPISLFQELESGDILFIDSSHVVKVDSDVDFLFREVIPRLKNGVVVHIHDILWPFEYPEHWLGEGRAWNEAYIVRAFLQFNSSFEILIFNDMLTRHGGEALRRRLPDFFARKGGSLWIRRVQS